MPSFQEDLRALLANRNSREAREFFHALMVYVDRKVHSLWRQRWEDVLGNAEREEVVGQVMLELLSGGLVRFQGENLNQLYAYTRTITERALLSRAQSRLRQERLSRADADPFGRAVTPRPDDFSDCPDEIPLSAADQDYLLGLLRAGGQAEYARRLEVSRAAVTLRLQRISARVEAMSQNDQASVRAWCEHAAQRVESGDIP